jgi:hypothetical protein
MGEFSMLLSIRGNAARPIRSAAIAIGQTFNYYRDRLPGWLFLAFLLDRFQLAPGNYTVNTCSWVIREAGSAEILWRAVAPE